ncbi:hypothetical protein [Streptomyces sp. NPDC050164]|uniref:hypothetical protein n=1 Tax=Streptomyces sp. NPDC050164 TaxID=3365605 RepID=UPI003795B453
MVSSTPSDEGIQAALHPLLRAKGQEDATLQYFVNDVERDLRGFADDDSELVYSDHEQGFEYYWSKATGEGTGTQPRRDYFRLGRAIPVSCMRSSRRNAIRSPLVRRSDLSQRR